MEEEETDVCKDRDRAGGMQVIYQKHQAERHVNPVNSLKTGSHIKGSGNKVNLWQEAFVEGVS